MTGPTLPDGADEHVVAFVSCHRDRVELAAGPVTWLPLPPGVPSFLGKPKARFQPDGQGIKATVKWGFASISVQAWIADGFLAARTAGFAYGLDGAVQRWVDSMNDQLRDKDRRLDRVMLVGDDVVITKRRTEAEG